jgi:predicted nucleic acid-binding protein
LSGFLLDTNVLSELVRKRPSERVLARMRNTPPESLATSSICVMELRYGTARHPQGQALWERISQEVLPRVRVLPLATAEAKKAGDLIAVLEAQGKIIELEDILIGATALVNRLATVTRNVRHFDRIEGLKVESWWE